jgi:hypothetical protein
LFFPTFAKTPLDLHQSFGYLNISLIYQKRMEEQIYTRVIDILPRAPEAGTEFRVAW